MFNSGTTKNLRKNLQYDRMCLMAVSRILIVDDIVVDPRALAWTGDVEGRREDALMREGAPQPVVDADIVANHSSSIPDIPGWCSAAVVAHQQESALVVVAVVVLD